MMTPALPQNDKLPNAEGPPNEVLKERMRSTMMESLPIVVWGTVVVYAAITLLHLQLLEASEKVILVPLSSASIAVGLGLIFGFRRNRFTPNHAVIITSVLALIFLANSLSHLYLSGDPKHATNLMMVVVGMGFISPVLSVVLMVNISVMIGWFGLLLVYPHVDGEAFGHFTSGLVIALILSHTCSAMRASWMKRLILAQFREEDNQRQIKAAHHELHQKAESVELALERELVANEAKSQFLAMISHEIQTPLNGIVAMADLLGESSADREQLQKIDVIAKSSEVLLNVINDVLDMSKIEAGKIEIEAVPIDLKAEIETLETIFKPQTDAKGLKLSVECEDDMACHVVGDPLRMRQILTNLLGNAVKFTDKGEVTLKVEARRCAKNGNKNCQYRFAVTDTGIGMNEKELTLLFRPFVQTDASVSRKYGGTGLGLSVSKQLAELMGGAISVASTKGRGSCFSLELPLEMAEDQAEASCQMSAQKTPPNTIERVENASSNKRILVAEDNATNRIVVKSILASKGYEATFVENGQEAVEKARHERFDLIFMDIQMPIMDGLTAAKLIRDGDFASHDATIFALSANAGVDDQRKAAEHLMDGHIAKPVRPVELIDVVREAFGSAA